MKITKLILLNFFLTLSLVSCQQSCPDAAHQKIMGDFYKKTLSIPENWLLLNSGYVKKNDLLDPKSPNAKFYVIKYFSVDCDKCIDQLTSIQKYIHENKEKFPDMKYVFVAYGNTDVYIKEAIGKLKFEYPVYFEKDYMKFYTVNSIPVDNEPLYGTMLVNKANELLLFGSVYNNPKAEKMFAEAILCQ